jgi:hypothetical protein
MTPVTETTELFPPGLLLLFGFFLLLFIAAAVMLVRNNSSRKTNRRRAAGDVPDWQNALEPAGKAADSALPDLDMLLGAPAPAPAAPAPSRKPAPQTAPLASSEPSIYAPPVQPAPVYAEPAPPARKNGRHAVRLTNGREVEVTDLMTVSRNLDDGTLVIQMGSAAYAGPAGMDDPEVRRRFTSTLKDLVKQASAPDLPRSTGEASRVQTAPGQAAPPAAPRMEPPAPRPTAAPMPTPMPAAMMGEMPGDLPKFTTNDSKPLKLRGGKPTTPVPEINIAGAIEAYLQFKLQQTPEFAGRHIHIHPSAHGGVSIDVDGQRFESVADIVDWPTRNFLQTTIEEWQSRQ